VARHCTEALEFAHIYENAVLASRHAATRFHSTGAPVVRRIELVRNYAIQPERPTIDPLGEQRSNAATNYCGSAVDLCFFGNGSAAEDSSADRSSSDGPSTTDSSAVNCSSDDVPSAEYSSVVGSSAVKGRSAVGGCPVVSKYLGSADQNCSPLTPKERSQN
jgi:hypothetical protein